MKLEGEYAVDKSDKYHRIAFVIFVVAWIGWSISDGMVGLLKSKGFMLIPLLLICFPEMMASRTPYFPTRTVVHYYRWMGWVLLLMPLMIPWVVKRFW
jgi:hypothetical protein